MSRDSFLDFSTTAGDNTDVAGISIAEGMPPGNVNNAFRQFIAIARRDVPAFRLPDIILVDRREKNTAGGGFVSGAWRTRALLYEDRDTNSLCTLDTEAKTFTLKPGSYYIDASVPAFGVGRHKARLYNVTDGAVALVGSSEATGQADNVMTRSRISGLVEIVADTAFRIEHWCANTRNDDGYGIATNVTITGTSTEEEIYTQVEIRSFASTAADSVYRDQTIALIETGVTDAQTAATAAETAQTNAESAETGALAAQTAAEAAKTDAEAAASLVSGVLAASDIYANTTAGLAGVSSGEYFYVPGSATYSFVDLYLDNAGSAVLQKSMPAVTAIVDEYGVQLNQSTGILSGEYAVERYVQRAITATNFYGEIIGPDVGTIFVLFLVNGVSVYSATVSSGGATTATGLSLSIPIGATVSVNVSVTTGAPTAFVAKLWGTLA